MSNAFLKSQDTTNLNTFWGQLIIEELFRQGVTQCYLSPGSRCAPLTAAVAHFEGINDTICYDERSAAFQAIGYARGTGKPAVVITTSGTAAANLYPAVIEASLDHLPLILLTADRPPELRATQANQTIDQVKLFGNYVKFFFDVPAPNESIKPEVLLTTVDQAVYRSLEGTAGPVHLNCMYREPLEPQDIEIRAQYLSGIENWKTSGKPYTEYEVTSKIAKPSVIKEIAGLLNETDRGWLVVGKLRSDGEREGIHQLIQKLKWPVYADVTSGLRLTKTGTHIIRHVDQLRNTSELNERMKPEIVLQIGGRLTSKRYPQYLEENRPEQYIVIKQNADRYDPLHLVSRHIETEIVSFTQELVIRLNEKEGSDYSAWFSEKTSRVQEVIETAVSVDNSLNEVFIAREISRQIPEGNGLFLSNSMPVRDIDLYSDNQKSKIEVASNRGTSGIDGVLSSAIGFAEGISKPTTLLIGDLALIHDLNALSLLKNARQPIIVIIVNNQGGGIFHFLPIVKSQDIFEKYFAAPHSFKFKGVAETFQIPCIQVNTKVAFTDAYLSALQENKTVLIEAATNRETNLQLRKDIKEAILEILMQ